ncbi:MAG TPA: DUF3862 domain-containing protein [Dissulfurispiraceae bacterium]|nr:DUF3862 domain-containing protein [Dissulfurispiraceae bacterium]
MKKRLFLIIFVGFVLGYLAGCSRLTMDNYNKIKGGMAYDEVVKILGSPDKCNDVIGMRNCVWGDEKKSVTVAFVGDKVLLFSANNIR